MLLSMVIQMNDRQLQTLAQLQAFLDGTMAVDFALSAEERYGFIGRTVRRFDYPRLKRAEKAVVLRFLERVQFERDLVPDASGAAELLPRSAADRTAVKSVIITKERPHKNATLRQ